MHPAQQYISDILDGTIPACKYIKWAVQRHIDDLEKVDDPDYPYKFDEETAKWYIDLFQFFILYEGEAANKPFDLSELPWIQFQLWCIFGWKRKKNDKRRFRKAYILVAKKNIKTTLAGCLGLIGLLFDGESGAQIYSAASNAKQAKICFRAAREIAKKSPAIRKRLEILSHNISHFDSASFFEYISSQSAQTKDGLNPHFSIIDEYHAHPDNEVHDVLDSATAARQQPLVYIITTEGFNQNGPHADLRDYCIKIIDPNSTVEDDSIFFLYFTLDEDDDWEDESKWIKANPSLGVSVKIDDLRAKARTAKQLPSALNNFKTKHLDVPVQSQDSFIEMKKWDACGFTNIKAPMHYLSELIDKYRGLRAFCGLDLGSVSDFTSFVMIVEVEKDWDWDIVPMFWIPEDTLRERKNKEIITPWIREGYIQTTPGDYTDHDFVEDTIKEIFRHINIVELAYDPRGMQQMATHLEHEGIEIEYMPQNYYRMEPCLKAFEQLVVSKKINHGKNPVLRWQVDNIAIAMNRKEERMFDKKNAPDKIDGAQALAMSIGRAMVNQEEDETSDWNEFKVLEMD